MTYQEAKETTIFFIENQIVESSSLSEFVFKSIEETTSPRGVEPKLHIRENFKDVYDEETEEYIGQDQIYEVWDWGFRGQFPIKVDEFETEEEAEELIFQRTYEYDFLPDDQRNTSYYATYEEALNELASIISYQDDIDVEVAKSIIHHNDCLIKLKEERKAKWQKESNEKKEALQKAVKAEAATMKADNEFLNEVNQIKASQVKGENKSKELSEAFQKFLKRIGKEKIESDYWQVFRILTK